MINNLVRWLVVSARAWCTVVPLLLVHLNHNDFQLKSYNLYDTRESQFFIQKRTEEYKYSG